MIPVMPSIRLFSERNDTAILVHALVLEHDVYCYHLHAQTGDSIHVFSHGICLYVLTVNSTYRRISLYTYMKPEADAINCVHLDGENEIRELLGNMWERLSVRVIVQRLLKQMV